MKVVFICQTIDENDPVLATTVRWASLFANHLSVDSLAIVTLREGDHTLGPGVPIHRISGASRAARLWRFYGILQHLVVREKFDCFFIYQGGPFPILLAPYKFLLGKSVFQWKAHPHVDMATRIGAKLVNDRVFTCTRKSLPIDGPRVRVLGHGIDMTTFRPPETDGEKSSQIVSVGRISPRKNLDVVLRALALCKKKLSAEYTLDLYGVAMTPEDQAHERALRTLTADLGLTDQVRFWGRVQHCDVPEILQRSRVAVNVSGTALDKAVVEAFACGVPTVSSNPCVAETLPARLRPELYCEVLDPDTLAEKLHHLLSMDASTRARIGRLLRAIAEEGHSDEQLIDCMVTEMSECLN